MSSDSHQDEKSPHPKWIMMVSATVLALADKCIKCRYYQKGITRFWFAIPHVHGKIASIMIKDYVYGEWLLV